jgi:hypothetical protein
VGANSLRVCRAVPVRRAHPRSALDGCNCAQVINRRDGVINRSVSESADASGVLGIYVGNRSMKSSVAQRLAEV